MENLNNLKLKLNQQMKAKSVDSENEIKSVDLENNVKPEIKEKFINKEKTQVQLDPFEIFKTSVLKRLQSDKTLKNLRLKTIITGTYIIIYQGVKTNIIARFSKGKKYLVYRSIITKKLSDLIKDYYQ